MELNILVSEAIENKDDINNTDFDNIKKKIQNDYYDCYNKVKTLFIQFENSFTKKNEDDKKRDLNNKDSNILSELKYEICRLKFFKNIIGIFNDSFHLNRIELEFLNPEMTNKNLGKNNKI